jgi:hypothetical protein
MKIEKPAFSEPSQRSGNVPGIVIADGGFGSARVQERPRLRAFIYGESLPAAPTLPFGRWKAAS